MANESQGNVITSAELLEISFVPVPANQEALRLAMTKGLVDLGKKDLGSIRIDIEKAIDALNKGEVSVQLDAEEAYEQKWEKWDEISEVLSALWTVYFDEKTPVEDFSSLLAEAIELLNEVAENDGVDEDDADEDEKALIKSHKERLTKFLGGRTIKSGKAISKKNAELIQKAIDHMKECSAHLTEQAKAHTENAQTHNDHVTALEEMLNTSSSSETGGGNKSVESVPAGSLVISEQDIKVMRQSFRSLDRTAELALSIVDRFLTTRDSKK